MLTQSNARPRDRQTGASATPSTPPAAPRYALEPDGRYRIDKYDTAPAFCSFLPGIAGPRGVPLWCLYVNRAQGVASFGVGDKDHAIVEFLPATWAYQLVGIQGFRTFCKLDGAFHEPFRSADAATGVRRTLHIQADVLEFAEIDESRRLAFHVRYFAPVNRVLGALARRLTVENRGDRPRQITLLDGLPLIIPAGFTDQGLKTLRHIYEAYASVRLVAEQVPYYAAKVAAHDEAEVVPVTAGNFYAAWLSQDRRWQALQPLVDPHLVFGGGHDLVTPRHFIDREALDRAAQVWENRMPCALAPVHAVLEPGAKLEVHALVGHAPDEHTLTEFLAGCTRAADFEAALQESQALLDDVLAPARQISSLPVLDGYVRQNYLDNVLRGGVPRALPSARGATLIHLYARRHGDLERDYNYFVVPPHPLSSGAGNFRDICQNRRSDVWFYPEVGAHEIRTFVALLQADGYNPLGVDGYRWCLPAAEARQHCPATDAAAVTEFERLLGRGCVPGELLQWARRHRVAADEAWLNDLLSRCEPHLVAHGHDGGYWIDHWTYITDLLEAFAAVYPDEVARMLTGATDVGWFDEGAYVRPRAEKYQRRTAGPLQVGAVADGRPGEPLPPTTVLGKLCALVAIKAVSFDAAGRGLEMEAGRPGWNDSLNGLPGLFGSSACEAAELARLALWLLEAAPQPPDTDLPVEVAEFVEQVAADVADAYDWSRAVKLRESYRARLRAGVTGPTRRISGSVLRRLLEGSRRRAEAAIARSLDPQTGLLHTYFRNRPRSPADGEPASVTAFDSEPLPLYLEGQVRLLRLPGGRARAREIHAAVCRSPLLDPQLRMYKLNECLAACPPEIGRARTFTRGWFENESIWLHMSYKYLLELLRAGLYEEFFADARTMLVPFMDPAVYGRSVLENSSFLGSSANPDPATHGRGFIARLSGSTAEFIHMWLLLTVGPRPFTLADGELRFAVAPALPGAWFIAEPVQRRWGATDLDLPAGSFACTLLGSILLVYHNTARRDTFGTHGVRPVRYALDEGAPVNAPVLDAALAQRIRARECRRLDVWLA